MQEAPLTAIAQSMAQFLNDLEQAIGPIGDVLNMFNNIYVCAPPKTKHRKRSSRRALVQAKRAQLGLSVNGKVEPFVYSAELFDLKTCQYTLNEKHFKPTRKESYKAAIEVDRIIRTYPEWVIEGEDIDAQRQRIIQNWMRWQMRVHYVSPSTH